MQCVYTYLFYKYNFCFILDFTILFVCVCVVACATFVVSPYRAAWGCEQQ